jgi:GxxExxY protein
MPGSMLNDPRTRAILGAAFEVHNTLGPGFQETVYQSALALEFAARDLDASREVWMEIFYKGIKVGTRRVDFVVEDVMVEIKARSTEEPADFVQTLSYLRASGFEVALLLNFGMRRLAYHRLIHASTLPLMIP